MDINCEECGPVGWALKRSYMGDQASGITIAHFVGPVKMAHSWFVFFCFLASAFGSIGFAGHWDDLVPSVIGCFGTAFVVE
jgi:hypothetical protein